VTPFSRQSVCARRGGMVVVHDFFLLFEVIMLAIISLIVDFFS
jgi:hypothetical protein